MSVTVKVLELIEKEDGDKVVLRNVRDGVVFTLTTDPGDEIEALKPGAMFTLAFVPFVAQDHMDADTSAIAVADSPSDPVPVDHPLVMDPEDAALGVPCDPETVVVADPTASTESATNSAPSSDTTAATDPTADNATSSPAQPEVASSSAAPTDAVPSPDSSPSLPPSADASTPAGSAE